MTAYLVRRLLLVIPTLFGIIAINFAVIQFAPGAGGPDAGGIARPWRPSTRLGSAASDVGSQPGQLSRRQWPRSDVVADIKKMFGFDKPPLTRFEDMVGGYLRFDFGRSFFRDESVLNSSAEDAGVDLARPVVHAAGLHDLDPAWHRQGGA